MLTASQDDILLKKLRVRTAREKAEIITAFLNECGEHASWEDWCDFLHKRQARGFEWCFRILSVAVPNDKDRTRNK